MDETRYYPPRAMNLWQRIGRLFYRAVFSMAFRLGWEWGRFSIETALVDEYGKVERVPRRIRENLLTV